MKLYGSLQNRLEENKMYCDEIKVGTYATMYSYSNRHAFEVVKVENQKHIYVRQLKAIRIDNNGMSDSQSYRYESNEDNLILELELTKYGWKKVIRYNKELYNLLMKRQGYTLWDYDIQQKVLEGKEVKRSYKVNISFGIADEYYDYSF